MKGPEQCPNTPTNNARIERTHNTARFFTETRHVAWVLLLRHGVLGRLRLPEDAAAQGSRTSRSGRRSRSVRGPAPAPRRSKQLVTRRIEEKIAENVKVDKIESNTRTGITAVYITLVEGTAEDTGKEFDDIKLKLDTIRDLPDGAGPIDFVKDFGDTAALMLTVASPRITDAEIGVRAQSIKRAIEAARAAAGASQCFTAFPVLPVRPVLRPRPARPAL